MTRLIVLGCVLLLAATGCSKKPDERDDDKTTGEEMVEDVDETTEEAADDTGDAVEEGAETVDEAVEPDPEPAPPTP